MRPLILALVWTLTTAPAWALSDPTAIGAGYPRAAGRLAATAAAGPNDAVLGYDSGPAYFFPDATALGTLWGVHFSPAQACSLLTLQVYAFQGGGQVRFHFRRDSSGAPGSEFSPPQVRTLVGNLSLEEVAISPVDVGAGDFYVVMEVITGPPPYPVTDADGGSGRSWFQFPGQAWEHVTDFDINMRAGVRYYGADLAGPQIDHLPLSLGFTEAFSTEIRCDLSDLSGIQRGLVFYRVQGTSAFDSSAMVNVQDNEWSSELPPFAAGVVVEYFIRAYDASATHNLTTSPSGAPALLYSYRMHPGLELAYDDGRPELLFYIDTAWSGNTFAVRMTPPYYPVQLNLLRAFVTDTTAFDFEVRAAAGDSPTDLLAGPFECRAQEAMAWADLLIPDGQAPTITSGDVFVLFKWKSNSPTSPAVGADSVAAADNRSYSYDGTYGWYKYPMFDWLIRAAVVTATGVVELGGPALPEGFQLKQNIPNPFNPSTAIDFNLVALTHVQLDVFNLLGQKVRTLVNEVLPAGSYRATFEAHDDAGRSLPTGLYFYRLDTGRERQTRKMMLLR
jgi:hypothetical protein